MKTEYKHVYFVDLEQESEHMVWVCYNNSAADAIGLVQWYPKWQQYCFYPEPHTFFSVSCHANINDFIGQLKK